MVSSSSGGVGPIHLSNPRTGEGQRAEGGHGFLGKRGFGPCESLGHRLRLEVGCPVDGDAGLVAVLGGGGLCMYVRMKPGLVRTKR